MQSFARRFVKGAARMSQLNHGTVQNPQCCGGPASERGHQPGTTGSGRAQRPKQHRAGVCRAVAARRTERSAVHFETARFIERNIPNFKILPPEALEIIKANAKTLLAEVRVK